MSILLSYPEPHPFLRKDKVRGGSFSLWKHKVFSDECDLPYEDIGFDTPSLVGGVFMCFITEEQRDGGHAPHVLKTYMYFPHHCSDAKLFFFPELRPSNFQKSYEFLRFSMFFYVFLYLSMLFYIFLWCCNVLFYDLLWCSMFFYDFAMPFLIFNGFLTFPMELIIFEIWYSDLAPSTDLDTAKTTSTTRSPQTPQKTGF